MSWLELNDMFVWAYACEPECLDLSTYCMGGEL
jgi:hypothetical protein